MNRTFLFLATLLTGLVLAVAGFALAAPIGPTLGPETSNPRMPFAPGLFVIGITMMFFSAVVYELVPDRKNRR